MSCSRIARVASVHLHRVEMPNWLVVSQASRPGSSALAKGGSFSRMTADGIWQLLQDLFTQ
jgi:hypothetical protein